MPLIRSDPFSKWPFSKVLIFELNNFSKCPIFKVIVTHYSSVLLSKILSMKPQAEFATQKIDQEHEIFKNFNSYVHYQNSRFAP